MSPPDYKANFDESVFAGAIRALHVVVGLCLIGLTGYAQIGQPSIKNYFPVDYASEDYTSSPQNWGVVQSRGGQVYLGNSNAVLVFNGRSWDVVEGTQDLAFYKFASDTQGRIFTGGAGDLGYFRTDSSSGREYFVSIKEYLPDSAQAFDRIFHVAEHKGVVYFQSRSYLFGWNDGTFEIWGRPHEFKRVISASDALFVTTKTGLYRLNSGQLELAAPASYFKGMTVKGLVRLNGLTGRYLVATNTDGLHQIANGQAERISSPLDSVRIYSTVLLQDGTIAVGTKGNGLYLIDQSGRVIDIVDERSGLGHSKVVLPFVDREGALWVATALGTSRISHNARVRMVDENNGLDGIAKAVLSYDGGFLIGTAAGTYNAPREKDIAAAEPLARLGAIPTECWGIVHIEDTILVATTHAIQSLIANNLTTIYPRDQINGFHQSPYNPNRFWVAHRDKSVQQLLFHNGKLFKVGAPIELNHRIYALQEAADGTLWCGYQGLSRLHFGSFDSVPEVVELDSINNYRPEVGPVDLALIDGQLAIGGQKGIFRFNPETELLEHDASFGQKFSSGNHVAYNLTETRAGDVWVTTNNGQTGILRKQSNSTYAYDSLPLIRLPITDVFSIYEDPEGIMWFGGTEALVRYDPTVEKDYHVPYYALVQKVVAKNDSVIFWGSYSDSTGAPVYEQPASYIKTLDYEYNQLTFSYAAPFFDAPEKLEYSHMMDGQDADWSSWSDAHDVRYTNLPEGTYTFMVKARNVYGTISHTANYTFHILPPWYRTIWAYLAYVILGLAALWTIVRINSHRLLQAQKLLEQTVVERTAEIYEQKSEIETQARDLKTANDQLVELDQFKQGMTSMIVHDLKNPLNAILNADGSNQDSVRHSGKQMLNMVLDLLDVQKYEEGAMALDLVPCDLASLANAAIEGVQFLSSPKAIEITVHDLEAQAVMADPETLQRVFVNLLTNAIKFTPVHGKVSIYAEVAASGNLRVEVRDTGAGIAREYLETVFDKFAQVTAKKSGSVQSTGLGLTFCKLAVEAHGGSIGVASELGKGATFWLTLQRAEVGSVPTHVTEIAPAAEDGQTILSAADIAYLTPVARELAQLPVYKVTAIVEALQSAERGKSSAADAWLGAALAAIANVDRLGYQSLLNQVLNEGTKNV